MIESVDSPGPASGFSTPDAALRSRVRLICEPIAAAVLLGVAADQLFRLPSPWSYLAVLGSPWLVIAWACARGHRHVNTAVVSASVVMVGGLIVFAVFKLLSYGSDSIRPFLGEAAFWFIAGLVLAAITGVAAVWSRSSNRWMRAVGWALPISALLAEAVLAWTRIPAGSRSASVSLLVAGGAVMFAWGLRHNALWRLLATVCVVAASSLCLAAVVNSQIHSFV
jgi:hypothetical protein